MGKFTLLTTALARGYLFLVIVAVVNTAIAIYYYLCIVREACFREPHDQPALSVDWPTRALCCLLIAGTVLLGIAPGSVLSLISASLARVMVIR
jgi:NADH-quinone oxidoreductase subunit N